MCSVVSGSFVDNAVSATVAQLVEHGTHKPGVAGSSPAGGTIRLGRCGGLAHGRRSSLRSELRPLSLRRGE